MATAMTNPPPVSSSARMEAKRTDLAPGNRRQPVRGSPQAALHGTPPRNVHRAQRLLCRHVLIVRLCLWLRSVIRPPAGRLKTPRGIFERGPRFCAIQLLCSHIETSARGRKHSRISRISHVGSTTEVAKGALPNREPRRC
mmetsp:Transcript_14888/g.36437  ORF Transcript_14888/g.36437 Transcript_14888/m.36437 type:complete len:141 (+) Transcript_14888:218-640(+)